MKLKNMIETCNSRTEWKKEFMILRIKLLKEPNETKIKRKE